VPRLQARNLAMPFCEELAGINKRLGATGQRARAR
jgi:hypothetical protein